MSTNYFVFLEAVAPPGRLAAKLGSRPAPAHAPFEVVDDCAGNIDAGRRFDAFQARRGIDFEHERSALRALWIVANRRSSSVAT